VLVLKDGKLVLEKIGQTSGLARRCEIAEQFTGAMKLTIPIVVDKEDNRVNEAYAGWPERLYVVGLDGKIAYKGGPGPGGFKLGEALKWIDENVK
jgi:hypothetical protein